MKKLSLLILIASIAINISCKKKDDIVINQDNYLIFGHIYGMCSGESCVETYKLTDSKLFEDTLDSYSGGVYSFVELGNNNFEEVKDLVDYFPSELLAEKESVIGCPDCADGGGITIQYAENGNVRTWKIDKNKSNIPTYLHDFVDKVSDKILLINN